MRFDEVLIDPTADRLADALNRAAGGKLAADHHQEIAASFFSEPDGVIEVADIGQGTNQLVAAWWSDPAGRRHLRVLVHKPFEDFDGYEEEEEYEADALEGEEPPPGVPAVARVYPGAVLAVRVGDRPPATLAVCGCGNVGSPDALGWVGDRCGPCHDAHAEGRPVPGPTAVRGLTGGSAVIRFSPDGTAVVTSGPAGELAYVDVRTGAVTLSDRHRRQDGLSGVAFSPDGRSVLAGYWGNHHERWDIDTNTLAKYGDWGAFSQFAPSPDGRYFVTNGGLTVDAIDWADRRTPLKRVDGWRGLERGGWTRDGSQWVGMGEGGAFAAVDVPSGRTTVLREGVFAGIDPGGLDPEWAIDYLNVFAIDPEHDHVVVAIDDPEHGAHGPARLGGLRTDRGWRPLPYDDYSDNRMPQVYGFTPDGAWLLYSSSDGGLCFYPTDAGREPVTAVGLTGWGKLTPAAVAFGPDGETLAAQVPNGRLVWLWPWRRILAAVL